MKGLIHDAWFDGLVVVFTPCPTRFILIYTFCINGLSKRVQGYLSNGVTGLYLSRASSLGTLFCCKHDVWHCCIVRCRLWRYTRQKRRKHTNPEPLVFWVRSVCFDVKAPKQNHLGSLTPTRSCYQYNIVSGVAIDGWVSHI